MSEIQEESGICMFAYNNEKIDYVKFAHIAAAYVKRNMKNNATCLITDNGTYAYLKDSMSASLHDKCFDHVAYRETISSKDRISADIHTSGRYCPMEIYEASGSNNMCGRYFYIYIFSIER